MSEELTPEQQVQIAQAFNSPPILPTLSNVESGQAPDGTPIVIIHLQTPAGSMKTVWTRDDALTFARAIRKHAQSGPVLEEVKSKLIVPG